MVAEGLEEAGCEVNCARGDADVLVVEAAATCAEWNNTVVTADDTDKPGAANSVEMSIMEALAA